MAQPKVIDAEPALLFERLIDLEPSRPREARPFRTLSPDELRASIARELARIMDTRRAISVENALAEDEVAMTVLDYGIPDPTALSPQRIFDRQDLAAVIAKAVRVFEPRLRKPVVTVERDPAIRSAAVVTISGTMRVGARLEPVSFPMALTVRAANVAG
ncbi:MAG: hypothetical protein VR70_14130 [Rhodospirillaceae bacterium BRH_c57]|nr:MAG: hypothetical protein VR70_14130 [Rhodospirillaceae bacterium BRH_c57]